MNVAVTFSLLFSFRWQWSHWRQIQLPTSILFYLWYSLLGGSDNATYEVSSHVHLFSYPHFCTISICKEPEYERKILTNCSSTVAKTLSNINWVSPLCLTFNLLCEVISQELVKLQSCTIFRIPMNAVGKCSRVRLPIAIEPALMESGIWLVKKELLQCRDPFLARPIKSRLHLIGL